MLTLRVLIHEDGFVVSDGAKAGGRERFTIRCPKEKAAPNIAKLLKIRVLNMHG